MKDMTEEQLAALASQLSCPTGEHGLEVADMMHAGNIGMTTAAIEALNIRNGAAVLELGHGSAAHLGLILDKGADVTYTGLEISETMHVEAKQQNAEFVSQKRAHFALYNGNDIPFPDDSFDAILTVNTVYFWENHLHLLRELFRVLKPGGTFALTFAQKDFMQHLPFTKYGFQLFSNDDISALVHQTDFQLIEISVHEEVVTTRTGESVTRQFSVAKMRK